MFSNDFDIDNLRFRAKRIDSEQFIYGDLMTSNGKTYICPQIILDVDSDPDSVIFHHEFIEVSPFTIDRYTGYWDNDKRDIYESDVIRFNIEGMDKEFEGLVITFFKKFFILYNGLEVIPLRNNLRKGGSISWIKVVGTKYDEKFK